MGSNLVVWIIFGVLIAALIGFLVFTFVKDKRKNRKITQKRYELKRATIKASKELAIRIYTLIELNNDWVSKVEPGKSKIKMRHVNSIARKFLKEIYDSKAFKTIYIESPDSDPAYARNLAKLIERNSNLWNKYCQVEINYFKNFYDELKDDEKFESLKNDAIESIRKIYDEEIKK